MSEDTMSTSNYKAINVLCSSILFDHRFYEAQCCQDLHEDESLEEHYVLRGESQGLKPSKDFDPAFYAEMNPDVLAANVNLFYHYIKWGASEARYPSRSSLHADSRIVKRAGVFDLKFFRSKNFNFKRRGYSPIEQYLLSWKKGLRGNDTFDDKFYISFYPDVKITGLSPIIHYLTFGHDQARIRNFDELIKIKDIMLKDFDETFYRSECKNAGINSLEVDKLLDHYIAYGCFNGLNPSSNFDDQYYLRRYVDILNAKVDPYLHFLKHREIENRQGTCPIETYVRDGKQAYIIGRKTVFIANHEASKTGAPLLGLELSKYFCQTHNVIVSIGRTGEIADNFHANSYKMIVGKPHQVDIEYILSNLMKTEDIVVVIANSIESGDYILAASLAGIPNIALIHEFAEYIFPPGRMSKIIRTADQVVFPSMLVEKSAQMESIKVCGGAFNNRSIIHQGKISSFDHKSSLNYNVSELRNFILNKSQGRNKIVLGAGFVGMRKGIDLFISTAAIVSQFRKDVCFVWVGDGYYPNKDIQYSVWLQEMLRRMSLDNVVIMLPSQPSLEYIMRMSHVFYLPSRLDAFPNVFIDAVSEGLPVVCFDQATGCAEYVNSSKFDGFSVPYCDVNSASEAILNILKKYDEMKKKSSSNFDIIDFAFKEKNRTLAKELFDFSEYMKSLNIEIEKAQNLRSNVESQVEILLANELFDPKFYSGRSQGRVLARTFAVDYVCSSTKGLSQNNPRPGFSENLYRSKHSFDLGTAALIHKMRSKGSSKSDLSTHMCFELNKNHASATKARTLLHIHLHYEGLILEIIKKLIPNRSKIDLYITVTSEEVKKEVDFYCREWRGQLNVLVVNNKGRDLGAFLVKALPYASNRGYEYIGHVHGKKSVDVSDKFGDKWRNFLLDTLLGDGRPFADEILSFAYENKDVGLIFPEDNHNVGWGSNLDFAKNILENCNISQSLPERPIFPIGSMFWAKVEIFRSLSVFYRDMDDFPSEPLPYDGTILHALERLLPTVCEDAGFRWITVRCADITR